MDTLKEMIKKLVDFIKGMNKSAKLILALFLAFFVMFIWEPFRYVWIAGVVISLGYIVYRALKK